MAGFNPSEPRDESGRWSGIKGAVKRAGSRLAAASAEHMHAKRQAAGFAQDIATVAFLGGATVSAVKGLANLARPVGGHSPHSPVFSRPPQPQHPDHPKSSTTKTTPSKYPGNTGYNTLAGMGRAKTKIESTTGSERFRRIMRDARTLKKKGI
jgi:hypothetical protein